MIAPMFGTVSCYKTAIIRTDSEQETKSTRSLTVAITSDGQSALYVRFSLPNSMKSASSE